MQAQKAVRVSADTHRDLKIAAAKADTTIRALITKILREYVKNQLKNKV